MLSGIFMSCATTDDNRGAELDNMAEARGRRCR
jgi:hypothetical protein